MEEFIELADGFTQPIVKDAFISKCMNNKDLYHDLLVERNCAGFCGNPKCKKQVKFEDLSQCPVFCSEECMKRSEEFIKVPERKSFAPIGKIIEKHSDMLPPKPIKSFDPTLVEGYHALVGPYKENLQEILRWICDYPVSSIAGLNENQQIIFNMVNQQLQEVGIQLKESDDVMTFFTNMQVDNIGAVMDADDEFKKAFSFSLFGVLTDQDLTTTCQRLNISFTLFDQLTKIFQDMADAAFD